MKFSGKTLLMLGRNTGALEMVKYARSNGAVTIAADYYPVSESVVKQNSDVAIEVSTADIDALCSIVKEYHVDGILAGISEFNLLKAMEVSNICNLPFYCDKKQWEEVAHKDGFRKLCERNNVPCPKTLFTGSELTSDIIAGLSYPLVIKPVDACTSAGVHICVDEAELLAAIPDSFKCSSSGRIIIEQFVTGDEFTAHYTIVNGKASLSCVDNRIPVAVHEGNVTTIPIARVYPCTFLDEYINQVNDSMIALCDDIGITNGILFVQGLYDSTKNEFNIFEAGLRCAGEAPYRFIEKINGVNPMEVLVDLSLGVESSYSLTLEDPYMKGKCCGIVSFVTTGGKVGSIEGLEEAVASTSSVVNYESRYPVGSEAPSGDTLRQLMIRFVMICDSREAMARDVEYLNSHINVLDENGQNMVLKLEPSRLMEGV